LIEALQVEVLLAIQETPGGLCRAYAGDFIVGEEFQNAFTGSVFGSHVIFHV
jgi:hypothetical protein